MTTETEKRNDVWHYAITDGKERLVACSFSRIKAATDETAVHSLPWSPRGEIVRSPKVSRAASILHHIHMGRNLHGSSKTEPVSKSPFLIRTCNETTKIPQRQGERLSWTDKTGVFGKIWQGRCKCHDQKPLASDRAVSPLGSLNSSRGKIWRATKRRRQQSQTRTPHPQGRTFRWKESL